MSRRARYMKQLHRRPIVWLAWAAAVLYSSWPLGYLLNPLVSQHDLASQLEALHEPYAWVFIGMDVLTALVVTIVGIWQIHSHGERMWLKLGAVCYILFGFLVAVAALAPLNCDPETHDCGPILHNPLLIVHGVSSILSPAFLGVGLLALGVAVYRQRGTLWSRWAFVVMLLAWAFFGAWGLIAIHTHNITNILQYGFITICSLSIVLVIATIEYLRLTERDNAPPTG